MFAGGQVGKGDGMTNPDDLVTSEGVDEASAASTAEGAGSGGSPRTGAPAGEPRPAAEAPVDMESDEARQARKAAGAGQEMQVGEG